VVPITTDTAARPEPPQKRFLRQCRSCTVHTQRPSDRRVTEIIQMSYPARSSPPREYYDHYLGKHTCSITQGRLLFSLKEILNLRELVCAALYERAQRSHRPQQRLPCYTHLEYGPLQLQRFLRGFVTVAARGLVTARGLVEQRPKGPCNNWTDLVFMRVMSGFFGRAEVHMHAARYSCACLFFACARVFLRLFD
jgi:hypothetical protein